MQHRVPKRGSSSIQRARSPLISSILIIWRASLTRRDCDYTMGYQPATCKSRLNFARSKGSIQGMQRHDPLWADDYCGELTTKTTLKPSIVEFGAFRQRLCVKHVSIRGHMVHARAVALLETTDPNTRANHGDHGIFVHY